MISRQLCTRLALFLAVCFMVQPAVAQVPQVPTTAKDVIMSTKTPLGEASIVLPAGSAVNRPIGEDQEVTLSEGPFSATVAREDLVFPSPSPTVPVAQTAPEASPAPALSAESQPAVSWNNPDAVTAGAQWFEDWRILVPATAATLLGLYAIFATAALLRRPKRHEYDD